MNSEAPRISFVSLGCPKALVDSERILTHLRSEGYELSRHHDGADVVIVNTCGFLDSAKAESLEAIGLAMKENGKVIVTGCMGAEPEQIRHAFPNVLAITGPQQYESVLGAVHQAVPPAHDPFVDLVPPQGIKLTPRHYAYLKISEGCNNRCSFCIIPKLRGDLVSRPAGDVLREAERLVKAGVKELLVISQDTSAYGVDLKYAASPWRDREVRAKFLDLSAALGELGAWVRMHYVYPYPHVDAVVELMAEGKILPYIDIPFQHASPSVLKAMRRPAHQEKTAERIHRWREICSDMAIRSTFIVGFPGETDEDFEFLLDWLDEVKLDRVGCFKFEPVDGAPANELAGAVPEEVKQQRWNRFMQRQQAISARQLAKKVGRRVQVIVDESSGLTAKARTVWDAPEIDGTVHLTSRRPIRAGEIVTARIESADAYDLHAVVV
ncbi:30S ribosomal protein S12 methylthiotransferase RimO [Kaistia algarum]|uniref:30S ribosomal protein S12 methylthiotransferase RimO n=1 Tax=Kaistia algarum TaxID=2083279 RepID=UPI000CE7B307|nr:30S ribosomal protein S12 methylthiotransferase RimO [Kaistia algarum]MCX5514809.1 30S ribosomal protein S12 methylthiotransferase RimO [Kaistia algarum]PPE79572.1 30S ribosomal protein S12 methylthiotransferase RimO [Kaistia algarum]